MRSDELDRDACRAASDQVAERLAWVNRLRARLQAAGLDPADPPARELDEAWDCLHRVRVRLHYLSCRDVTGGPPAGTGAAG